MYFFGILHVNAHHGFNNKNNDIGCENNVFGCVYWWLKVCISLEVAKCMRWVKYHLMKTQMESKLKHGYEFFCVNVHKSYKSGQNLLHYLRWMGKSSSQRTFLINFQMIFISCSKNMMFIIPLIYYQKVPLFFGFKIITRLIITKPSWKVFRINWNPITDGNTYTIKNSG